MNGTENRNIKSSNYDKNVNRNERAAKRSYDRFRKIRAKLFHSVVLLGFLAVMHYKKSKKKQKTLRLFLVDSSRFNNTIT